MTKRQMKAMTESAVAIGRLRVIDCKAWKTPWTGVALRTVGTARTVRQNYRGLYRYEGVGGFEFYEARTWLPVVGLQQRHRGKWATWMVDDPLHWDGMREAVEALPDGRILVAGLGLGLMLHHIATMPRFTRVVVVEMNPDVVALVQPTLPEDSRVSIVVGDFYRHIETTRGEYDGVLWDLAVGGPEVTRPEFIRGQVLVAVHLGIPMVQFGMRRHAVQS